MKRVFIILTLLGIFSFSAFGGVSDAIEEGKLTPQILAEVQKSFGRTNMDRAVLNALNVNKLSDLAKNREVYNSLDFIFSDELETMKITDQENSGRCWLFATFNILRVKVAKENNLKNFEFSENYSMFWDKLEKANLFLEYVIMNRKDLSEPEGYNDREFVLLLKTPIPDGGFWHMAANCVQKYGAIPKEAMPESEHSSNTRELNNILSLRLRIDAAEMLEMTKKGSSDKKLRQAKVEMLKDVYRILVFMLGEPPAEFQWKYVDKDGKKSPMKTYTPKSFYDEVVGVDLKQYVVIGNCPSQPFGKNYQVKLGRGQLEGMDWTFLNLEMERLKSYAFKVLQDTVPIEFSVDIGQQKDSKKGFLALGLFDYEALLGVKLPFDKAAWIITRESAPNHSMALVGVDVVEGKPVKWKVENSWGTDRGDDGFFMMTDDWFGNFGFSIVIDKKYLDEDVLKMLEAKPVMLPFWDPLARTISVDGYDN